MMQWDFQWDFQKKGKSGWYEFLYSGSPTALFASQLNLFCTMWPDHAKGLLLLRPAWDSLGDQASFCDSENYAGKTIGHTDPAKPDWLKGPLKYNLAQISWQIYRHKIIISLITKVAVC